MSRACYIKGYAWSRDRWAATKAEDEQRKKDFYAQAPPNSTYGSQLWRWGTEVPRSCTKCGSLHPEDALKLVFAGWTVEAADNKPKWYLHPPKNTGAPVPPVKLYGWHLEPADVTALNDVIRANRKRKKHDSG